MIVKCDVIQDLLPLYAEDLVSEGSRVLIEEHVQQCEVCKQILEKTKLNVTVPMEADTTSLCHLRRRIRKRTVWSIVTALMLVVTIFLGICVCGIVPVWMSADEAIESIEENNGRVRVALAENTWRLNHFGDDGFCYEGLRLTWFADLIRGEGAVQGKKYIGFDLMPGESLWYLGRYTGDEDTLLFGDGADSSPQGTTGIEPDKTLLYVFVAVLGGGVLMLIPGILLRGKLTGKIMLAVAAMLLCCAVSCLFVTNGHLLTQPTGLSGWMLLRSQSDVQQYIAICLMTIVSFLTVFSGYHTVKVYRD